MSSVETIKVGPANKDAPRHIACHYASASSVKSGFGPLTFVLALFLLAIQIPQAFAANYPLELTNIKPAGDGLNPSHRIFRAYPGLEYNIRAAVIGGDYPYTYSLSNAPEGMTIASSTGEISWPNPQADAQPTITVSDSVGATVSATWAVQVTTNGFRFVDAVRGASTGDGSAANPWRTMADVYYNAGATDIIYFRSGTYDQLSLPRAGVGGHWERVEWEGRASIWLAYPDEQPIIDFGYRGDGSENAPMIRLNGDLVYVDGFETINAHLIGFQFVGTSQGPTFRNMEMHALGPGIDGSNASFIMTTVSTSNPASYMVVQDSEFYDLTGNATTLKIYSQHKLLIEDTVHRDSSVGIELKADVGQFTVRNNRFSDITAFALGGNMHYNTTYGEILFNLIRSPNALRLNQDGMARQIDVYRNTFVGEVLISATDSADGPFRFSDNVIVNSDNGTPAGSHITHGEVTAPDRVVLLDNLSGYLSDNIVDPNGNLTTTYSDFIAVRGYQQGPAPVGPNPPTNVTVAE